MAIHSILLSLLAVLVVISALIHVTHGCGVNIVNSCSFSITTCAQSGSSPASQYQLGAGASQYLDLGSACSWPDAAIYPSVTGNCSNPDRPFANLAEFNIVSPTDFYDLSNVNAYTVGLGISVTRSLGGDCATITCSIPDIVAFCEAAGGKLVTEPTGLQSCINTGSPGLLPMPEDTYSLSFDKACPQAVNDSLEGSKVNACDHGSSYQVEFCP